MSIRKDESCEYKRTCAAFGKCNILCEVKMKQLEAKHARWTRKNREKRLRRKMDLLNSQLFLCSWFIERHMGLARKFAEFVKETPVECSQGDRLISTTYFTVTRRDVEGS